MTARVSTPLARVAVPIMDGLYQHRLLSTNQVHALFTPASSIRWTQRVLAQLQRAGLADAAPVAQGLRLWYLTEQGADAVEQVATRPEMRRKLTRPEQATGQLRRHTLAVNDVGIAFVRAARERGDDCGPMSWRHEIAHPLGPPPGRRGSEQLIVDALLTYQLNASDGPSFHYRFVELDRATVPVDHLADKLAKYVRLYRHQRPADGRDDAPRPLWTDSYAVFPSVLVVLAGQPRARLERRRATVLGLCRAEPQLVGAPEVEIAVGLLDDLTGRGPFGEVFCTPAAPDRPTGWLSDD